MDNIVFHSLVTLLGLTILVNLLFRFIKLPIILGYLVIGMLAGPELFGWLSKGELIDEVAEFGLVFLMFGIGLEFSLNKLWEMRDGVFLYGGGQVLISIFSSMSIGALLHVSWVHNVIIGSIVAMSSTAVVSKLLAEKKELGFQYGRDMIAILLMQDILVVPVLVMLPFLKSAHNLSELLQVASIALFKGFALVISMTILGRYVLKPIFKLSVRAHSDELFMLVTLFVVILASWMSLQLKLSLSLGAFLAGMMLSETAYRHKISSEIRPFQDVFLGLFFVSVGMYFNFNVISLYWQWLILMLAGLMLGKAALIFFLGLLLKRSPFSSLMTSVRLSHGGEFGFAILVLTQKYDLMPQSYTQVILAGLLLSLVLGVLLNHLTPLFLRKLNRISSELSRSTLEEAPVMLCGYGHVGKEVGSALAEGGVPFYAVDTNPDKIEKAIERNHPVFYVDAGLREISYVIHDMHPSAIIICFSDEDTIINTAKQIKHSGYQGQIIARTYDDKHADYLKELGVTHLIPELPETVFAILEGLLSEMDIQESAVQSILDAYKAKRSLEVL